MLQECREGFHRHCGLAISTCITCVTHLPRCMPWSLTTGFLRSRWQGKRSRHSRCMRDPEFYASGKRPVELSSSVVRKFVVVPSVSCRSSVTRIISYLGMKSWDLHVCDRASTITHVDHVKKSNPWYNKIWLCLNVTIWSSQFFFQLLSFIIVIISKYLGKNCAYSHFFQ